MVSLLQQSWSFLVPLFGMIVFSCCLFFCAAILGLLYAHRQDAREIVLHKAIAYACIVALVMLDAGRAIWDACSASHFPTEIGYPLMVAILIIGGRALFRLSVLRTRELHKAEHPTKGTHVHPNEAVALDRRSHP